MAATPTRVSLEQLVPKLYKVRDANIGTWTKLLQVLEDTINDILSASGTRAFLDCSKLGDGTLDSVFEAVSEGEGGTAILLRVEGDGASPPVCTTSITPSPAVTINFHPGVSTIAEIEAAVAAEVLPDGVDPLIRLRTPGTQARVIQATIGTGATVFGNLNGESPTGHVLGKVSVDAQSDIFDPLRAERRLLPYLAQKFGWALDPELREGIQRKVLTLLRPLYEEKGTPQGIVDALRLLLGVDVAYHDLWGDGWRLGKSKLGVDTYLAPSQHAEAYSRGQLVGVDPGRFLDNDPLTCPAWATAFEIQKTPSVGGERAIGFLTAVPRSVLCNGLTLELPGKTFEFQVDDTFVPDASRRTIDVSDPACEDPAHAAAVIAAAISAEHGLAHITIDATSVGGIPTVRLIQDATGAVGNVAIGGSALEVLYVHGMFGGAGAGAFVPTGGKQQINLIGAADAPDVANRVADTIAYYVTTIAVTRSLDTALLRNRGKGSVGDGAISGAAAIALKATGMSGGIGVNRAILTFRIDVPRPLTADELRVAEAMVNFAKRAETHYILNVPPNPPPPGLFTLRGNQLGVAARLARGRHDYQYPTGDVEDDEFAWYIGRTWTTELIDVSGTPVSVRSPRLIVGSRYLVQVDTESYIRQGNRVVAATTDDFLVAALRRLTIVVGSAAQAYVAAMREVAGGTAFLRVTRVEGGA